MNKHSLYKLFYINPNEYKNEYERRFYDENTIHLDINISSHQAFFCQTPELYKKILSIERADKKIQYLCFCLPPKAIEQFAKRCLIDEIILTNNIEGVNSTRKEVSAILKDLSNNNKRKRFYGLVNKYALLMQNNEIPINTCQDIRKIYDDIFYEEIKEFNPENLPDGKIFRKESVSVYSQSDREIHHSILPESAIIDTMKKSLTFLHDANIEFLFRLAVFHYLFGYIHPFYDGNGRTSRFISSYLLSHELNHIIGYRISYTIKENIKEYYDAFKICNHPNNKGDLTPFIEMFLNIVDISVNQLSESLEERVQLLNIYEKSINKFPMAESNKLESLYFLLIQASLFSDIGISTSDLLSVLGISINTLRKKIKSIPNKLIIKKRQGNTNFYMLNREEANNYIIDENIEVN